MGREEALAKGAKNRTIFTRLSCGKLGHVAAFSWHFPGIFLAGESSDEKKERFTTRLKQNMGTPFGPWKLGAVCFPDGRNCRNLGVLRDWAGYSF